MAACLMLTAVSGFGQSKAENDRIVLGEEIMPKDTSSTRRFKNHLIAPKGEWQCGLSVMYADFSTDNVDYMLILQGLTADASVMRLSPEMSYTYAPNRALGARFQYTSINGGLDAVTADLLGNFSMSFGDVNATSRSMSGSVYHRTYVGLDNKGRVGIFWDYIFGYTRSKTQFYSGNPDSTYSINNKLNLAFAPGIIYFPMNNLSVQACISLADVSYNMVSAYEAGILAGKRHAWKAQASLNVLGINFGMTIHL